MTEKEYQRVKVICDGPWYKRLWIPRSLVVSARDEIRTLSAELLSANEQCRSAREMAQEYGAASRQAQAETTVLKEQNGEANKRLAERTEQMNRMQVEAERLKAEVEKTHAVLERSKLALDTERANHDKTKGQLVRNCRWIWLAHRLDNPPSEGMRGLLAGLARLSVFLLFLLPVLSFGALPPPVVGNSWSTNRPPMAVQGQDNLSVTNLGSGTNWQFYNVGPFTVARLIDVTNIASGAAGTLTTNANQFLGVPLSIKTGALQTNFNGFGLATNNSDFYFDILRSVTSGQSMIAESAPTDLTVGDVLYDHVNLQVTGPRSVALDGAGTPPSFAPFPHDTLDLGYPTLRWKEFWLAEDAYIGGRVEATQYVLTNSPGLDRNILMYHTNGQGYTAFSAPTNQWLPTNRFFVTVTNPSAGQVLKFLTVSSANGVSSIVLTNDSDSNPALTTNVNQFLGSPLSIKSGALQTNVTFWESNALLPALIATNQPGGTIDLATMLTTNGAGLRVTSNGAVVVNGVIGSLTNSFEVRSSNGVTPIFAVTHSNTVRIVTPNSGAAEAAGVIIDSVPGFSQTPVHFWVGGSPSGTWRADNVGNQIISSAQASGAIFFGPDGGSGTVNFNLATVGTVWSIVPNASTAPFIGGTLRRATITNVWDLFGRTNLWLGRTGLLDGIVITNDIRFLGHNSATGAVWTCTNTTTGEGEWRGVLTSFQPASTTLTNLSNTGAITNLNDNQFADEATIAAIRNGALVTNINNFGVLSVTNAPGLDRSMRLWNTNGGGFTEFSAPTNAWLPTNKFILSVTNPSAGQILKFLTVSLASGVASIVLTNDSDNNPTLTTNANQFLGVPLSIKDGVLITNAVFYPASPALTVTNIPGIATNTFQILNTNGQAVIFAATNNGMTLTASNTLFLGPHTNASSANVAGGVTNWIQTEVKGTLNASSNLLVKAGQSTSNAWVGGTIWFDQNSWTNLNGVPGTLTNLSTNIIAGHVLTNNGDTVHIMWRIKLADAAANTNRFQIVYGSATVLDTGLQPCSNSVCQADLWVSRTGSTAQHADGRFEWGPGSGAPFAFTNNNAELVQTNGIATIFQLRASSQRVGAMTNNWTRGWFDPAPR